MGGHSGIRLSTEFVVAASLLFPAAGQEIEEYQVKAAYLYNFAKFVEWPAQVFASPASPIVICVLGEDPFGGALQDVVRGKTASRRTLVVRTIPEFSGAKGCQILFIGSLEWKRNRLALGNLNGSGVLTVGEEPGFGSSGGIINFKLEAGRVRFEINVAAARQAPVQISSKLLSLAERVAIRE